MNMGWGDGFLAKNIPVLLENLSSAPSAYTECLATARIVIVAAGDLMPFLASAGTHAHTQTLM